MSELEVLENMFEKEILAGFQEWCIEESRVQDCDSMADYQEILRESGLDCEIV